MFDLQPSRPYTAPTSQNVIVYLYEKNEEKHFSDFSAYPPVR